MSIFRRGGAGKLCLVLACCALVGCSSSPRFVREKGGEGTTGSQEPRTAPSSGGAVKPSTGKVLLTLEGIASYYADDFNGKLTSNGETFNMNDLTAAHRTFPFGTRIRVTNLDNQKIVVVRVNDRGPYVDGRIIDLSLGAARVLALTQSGTARVRLEVIQWGDGK